MTDPGIDSATLWKEETSDIPGALYNPKRKFKRKEQFWWEHSELPGHEILAVPEGLPLREKRSQQSGTQEKSWQELPALREATVVCVHRAGSLDNPNKACICICRPGYVVSS